ncbi:MAG TPA: hypothetical protein VEQ58_02595 [Polyangiaceae bacterium]|nr:hypothetical protein [Polyangiaceae bacterium]
MSHFNKRKYFLTLTIAFSAMSAMVVGCGDDDDDNNGGNAGSSGSGGSSSGGTTNGGVAGSAAGSQTGGTTTSGTGGTTGGTENTIAGAAGDTTVPPNNGGAGGTDIGDGGHENGGGTGPNDSGGAGAGPGPGPGNEGGAGGFAPGSAGAGGVGGEAFAGAAGSAGAGPTCTGLTMEQTASAATAHNHITVPGQAELQNLINEQDGPITWDLPTEYNHSHKITLTAGNVTTLRHGGEVEGVKSTGVTPPVPGTVPAHDHTYTISCDN